MKLTFEHRPSYGHIRHYPLDALAKALCSLAGRTSLTTEQLLELKKAGFAIELIDAITNVRKAV